MNEHDLHARGIELVALAFVDNAGIARAKPVVAAKLALAAQSGVGSWPGFAIFRGDDVHASSGGLEVPVGDSRLVADLASLRGGVDGWGFCAGDQRSQEGEPSPLCPRLFLKRMVQRAAEAGLTLQMTFELEWMAARDVGFTQLVHDGPAYSLRAASRSGDYLREIARRLAAYGLEVEQLHAEYSPGQLEASFAPRDPLTACDETVLARHAIQQAAQATGIEASFAPFVREGLIGNGAHLHVSVWRDGVNLLGSEAPEGRSFLAGVLAEIAAIVGLGCSSPLSWRRLGPSRWTSAYACWGIENREAPIRFIWGSQVSRPAATNFEIKVLDASANPYLVAGAAIAAGLAGMAAALECPPSLDLDPAKLSSEERARREIRPLPRDAEAGVAALRGSAVLGEALGAVLRDAVADVHEAEAADWADRLDDAPAYYRLRY